jgi:hypothetical protein
MLEEKSVLYTQRQRQNEPSYLVECHHLAGHLSTIVQRHTHAIVDLRK